MSLWKMRVNRTSIRLLAPAAAAPLTELELPGLDYLMEDHHPAIIALAYRQGQLELPDPPLEAIEQVALTGRAHSYYSLYLEHRGLFICRFERGMPPVVDQITFAVTARSYPSFRQIPRLLFNPGFPCSPGPDQPVGPAVETTAAWINQAWAAAYRWVLDRWAQLEFGLDIRTRPDPEQRTWALLGLVTGPHQEYTRNYPRPLKLLDFGHPRPMITPLDRRISDLAQLLELDPKPVLDQATFLHRLAT